MEEFHEAIILGGGPAGLTAGIYLKRSGIDALLLEKLFCGGAPLTTERIENYPGFPEAIAGRELMERMKLQAERFGLMIKELEEVKAVTKVEREFLVKTNKKTYKSLGVIVATGTVPKRLGIKGEEKFIGMGISFCATCDGPFFRDKRVAVVGGGDSAIEEALYLSKLAKEVYIIHRRERFRAQKILEERAKESKNIRFLLKRIPVEIEGEERIEGIILEDVESKRKERLEVDGVFVYIGSRPEISFLSDLVETDENGFIKTDGELSTKTKGLFAAGDVRTKSLRQIATAISDGAIAASSLVRYIDEIRG